MPRAEITEEVAQRRGDDDICGHANRQRKGTDSLHVPDIGQTLQLETTEVFMSRSE